MYDFCNIDHYWCYGEACSSRTNVCHRSYTSRVKNHFLPSSEFPFLMSVEDVLISK